MKHSFRMYAFVIASVLALASGAPSFARGSVPSDDFIESDGVRREIEDIWLGGELNHVLMLETAQYTDRYVYSFTVSRKKDETGAFLAVTVKPGESHGIRGTWVLFRRLSDGMSDSIRIYPVDDPSIYVVLRPSSDHPERGRSFLDLIVKNAAVCTDVPVGIPFVDLYTAPFASVVDMTGATVPWALLSPELYRYGDMESAVSVIRDAIKNLVYLDDGAFDENGNPVLIATGLPQDPAAILAARTKDNGEGDVWGGVNCSGFAKWIIDGIVRPRAGNGLFINPLKMQTPSPETQFTEPFRELRDVFFALDWTRNLASAVISLNTARTVKSDRSGVDVTANPFSGLPSWQVNVGYKATSLYPLMYSLAITEPGHFYLGAVSRERGTPPLRQYHHIAAFFPYFDGSGQFTVAVFESAVETTMESFQARNSDAYVNLVRVRIPEAGFFEP